VQTIFTTPHFSLFIKLQQPLLNTSKMLVSMFGEQHHQAQQETLLPLHRQ